MAWAQMIAAGSNMAGGAMAAKENAEGRAQARAAYDASVRDLEAIGIPSIEAQQMVAEEYKSQGQWTPELEEYVQLGPSAMAGIETDPAYHEAGIKALQSLQQIGDDGGLRLSDRARLESITGKIDSEQKGRRGAILQDAAERGDLGSGATLAAQLMAQQEGAQQAHLAGLETAASADARALEAIQAAGRLGGEMRGQEFGEKERIAAAEDEIARWNAANRQDVTSRNTNTGNTASRYNLESNQRISDANVDKRNQATAYNKGLEQTNYENQIAAATAKANARAGQATNAVTSAKDSAAIWQGAGSAVGQAATAAGQYANESSKRAAEEERRKTTPQPAMTY